MDSTGKSDRLVFVWHVWQIVISSAGFISREMWSAAAVYPPSPLLGFNGICICRRTIYG